MQWDMAQLDRIEHFVGREVFLGGGIRVLRYYDYIVYHDGPHKISFGKLLFKDGTEWKYNEPARRFV